MKKILFIGLLVSLVLFLLGGCGLSNISDVSLSVVNFFEKISDGRKNIDFWFFWGLGV